MTLDEQQDKILSETFKKLSADAKEPTDEDIKQEQLIKLQQLSYDDRLALLEEQMYDQFHSPKYLMDILYT